MICVFFMQHFFGIAPNGLCGGVFFIVCGNTSGSVFTATEGGIPQVAAFGVKAQGQQLKRGTAPGGNRGNKGPSRGVTASRWDPPKR